ncbi:hypothetical protein Trydic_g5334 [Trypoxylus dichotomus]
MKHQPKFIIQSLKLAEKALRIENKYATKKPSTTKTDEKQLKVYTLIQEDRRLRIQENRFLESIVTGDETWVHHHNSESKKLDDVEATEFINADNIQSSAGFVLRRDRLTKGFMLHNNIRPYISNQMKTWFQKHNWEVIVR